MLSNVAEHAVRAVIEYTRADAIDTLRIEQLMREPTLSARLQAWVLCVAWGKTEGILKARRVVRDLVLLTATFGQGEFDRCRLVSILTQAMREGSNRQAVSPDEISQLGLSFGKILNAGCCVEAFLPKARDVYGAWISMEEAVELFEAYNTVSMASPDYQCKNKETKKYRKPKPRAASTEGVPEPGKQVSKKSQPEDEESRFEVVVDIDTRQVEGGQDVLEITVYDNSAKMCVMSHSVMTIRADPKPMGTPTVRLRRGAPGLHRQSGSGG